MLVWDTIPDSPAARAGLRGTDPDAGVLGDVIIEANGQRIRRLGDLTDALEDVGIGQSIELTVRGGDTTRQVQISVEDLGAR